MSDHVSLGTNLDDLRTEIGSGGSTPYAGDATGATLTTDATDAALMSWVPSVYLDITDPQNPTFLTGGVYALTADVSYNGANQPGKFMWAQLGMGPTGGESYATASTLMDQGGINEEPAVAITIIGRVAAGDKINTYVGHDGANGSQFLSGVWIQKIID